MYPNIPPPTPEQIAEAQTLIQPLLTATIEQENNVLQLQKLK